MSKKSVTPSRIFAVCATILAAAAAWKALDTNQFLNRGARSVAGHSEAYRAPSTSVPVTAGAAQ
jgi:hypothetical protein